MPLAIAAVLSVALGAAPVHAADLPRRRSGLWEITTSQPGAPAAVSGQLCIDEKTDDLAQQLAQGAMSCSRQQVRPEGDGWVLDSVCRLGESTATTRARISGRFDSAYQVDIDSSYEPPIMGMRGGKATVKARWLGACRPGQRAGDMTLPGGVTINIFDAQQRAAKPGP
ncbi:MAG: hypothetical protein KJ018_07390 [Burkholderiales bacterium]|nr:hypothetical protein [Burkholderiales bacterium]GIK87236.1 MAG: hypothetical protein BroJett026_27170 [Betaproteobacteria bacterium]